jgi:hypothetical protein
MPNEMNVGVNEGNPNIIRQGFNVGLRTLSPTYMALILLCYPLWTMTPPG